MIHVKQLYKRLPMRYLPLLLLSFGLKAQDTVPRLYLMTDKSIYTQRETVWFSGYALDHPADDGCHTLYIELADTNGHVMAPPSRFLMAAGLGEGALNLPDSLEPGPYSLIAWTQGGRHPAAIYHTWINIRPRRTTGLPVPLVIYTEEPVAPYENRAVNFAISVPVKVPFRQRVVVQLACADSSGQPLRALMTVSVVRSSRLTGYERNIDALPRTEKDHSGLALPVWLRVRRKDHRPVQLLFMTSPPHTGVTDSSGLYFPMADELLGAFGRSATCAIADRSQQGMTLEVVRMDTLFGGMLARRHWPYMEITPDSPPVTALEARDARGELAAAVIVGHRWREDMEGGLVSATDSSCGAWICINKHLYCTRAPFCCNAVPGTRYTDPTTGRKILYAGCRPRTEAWVKQLPATWTAPQFPGFCKDSLPGEQVLRSTLYWNYAMALDKEGTGTFHFDTNDLPGRYTIVVQGITRMGPFRMEAYFTVMGE